MPITTTPKKRRSRGTKAGAHATAQRTLPTLPVVRTVAVKFTENDAYDRSTSELKAYHYLTDLDFEINDKAVVYANNKFCVVTVVALYSGGSPQASKWIIDRVDLAGAKARQERAQAVSRAHQLLEQAQASLRQEALLEFTLPALDPSDREFVIQALGLPSVPRRRAAARRKRAT